MKKVLITYGDSKYEMAKTRFVQQADALKIFDKIIAYSEQELSEGLRNSEVFKEKRGGGLWSWKPDVILTTLNNMEDGDILVYCDAGCSLYASKEWQRIWKEFHQYEVIAQRIYQRTDQWTRKNIIQYFETSNAQKWEKSFQFLATVVVLKATPFTRKLITEWRKIMTEHPELVKDVTCEERKSESKNFIENRHDQSIYSALIYKYLNIPAYCRKIKVQWEHIEDYDIFSKQAIRATRLRNGEKQELSSDKTKAILKRLIKDYIFRPFRYAPQQWYYKQK